MLTAALIAFAILLVAWIAAPAQRDRRSVPEPVSHRRIEWEPDAERPEALPRAA